MIDHDQYMYDYESLYDNGTIITFNDKDVCINEQIWVHKKFVVTCFEYFKGYFEKNDILQYNNTMHIDKNDLSIDLLMRCVYGVSLNNDTIKKYSWKILLEVLDLYDFLCPTEFFTNVFEKRYQTIIIDTIVKLSNRSNIFDILTHLDISSFKGSNELRSRLFDKHSTLLHFHRWYHAFYGHHLCNDDVITNTKIASLPQNTKDKLWFYHALHPTVMTKITDTLINFSHYCAHYDLYHTYPTFSSNSF